MSIVRDSAQIKASWLDEQAQVVHVSLPQLQVAGSVLANHIDFKLHRGVLHVLEGPNGVGKTTLLKVICQQWANTALAQSDAHEALVWLKAPFGFRPEFTVEQQLHHIMWLHHWPRNTWHERTPKVLSALGLADWSFERIGVLSTGQRARLGLAHLLCSKAMLWLLDEPLNALDAQGASLLGQLIAGHISRGGVVLMATHQSVNGMLAQLEDKVPVHTLRLQQGILQALDASPAKLAQTKSHKMFEPWPAPARKKFWETLKHRWHGLMLREWQLLRTAPQAMLWSALFLWMVLSFVGLSAPRGSHQTTAMIVPMVWVAVLLAAMLSVKDWFEDDQRSGWCAWLLLAKPNAVLGYWLCRTMLFACMLVLVCLPVVAIFALQMQMVPAQWVPLLLALAVGVLAITPLLSLLSILVLLARSGGVLVYALGLPLLVPVLIFGLEASQAAQAGRSALMPLWVLAAWGGLALLLGAPFSGRLLRLVQE